ncbi:MAG: prenyltransferase/squalene oxidase repeat-containing protein [Planctomycetota bacterium]
MEQLTVREQLAAQLRRAPSFAFAAGVVTVALVISAFITFSGPGPKGLPSVIAGLVEPDEPVIDKIDEKVDPKRRHERRNPLPREGKFEPEEMDREFDKEKIFDDPGVAIDDPAGPDAPPDDIDHPIPELPRLTLVIGVGGPFTGRGRVYRGRTEGGIRQAGPDGGMPPPTLPAIDDGLRWLARAQDKETGGWDVKRWGGSAERSTAGVSGLALLAFLSRGCTDRYPEKYARTVTKAVEFLVSRQHSEGANRGWFGERMYSQGICTMALSEASVMLRSPRLRRMARKAAQNGIDHILSKQPSHGGFGYTGPGNDTSVTGWQVMAIKSAMIAELRVPRDARERTENFLRLSMADDASTPYRINPSGGTGRGTPRMTAVALTARLFMGHSREAEDCVRQADWLTERGGHLTLASRGTDFYYIYYMSMAMFHMGGKYWTPWNKAFNVGLRARQVRTGPDKGSWPVAESAYGAHGGRVYTTAMACLALEVYFKHLPMYKML